MQFFLIVSDGLRRFDFHQIVSLYASDYDSVASENQPLDRL